ncbi:MAG: hypothetical protein DRQ35_03400, partial [Gammaproteobacteria bacterium]
MVVFNNHKGNCPVTFALRAVLLALSNIDLPTIGLFGLLSMTYTFKFLWSPLMDRYTFPFYGRRRGWMIVTQIPLLILIAALGLF